MRHLLNNSRRHQDISMIVLNYCFIFHWKFSWISNDMRNFLFLLRNNAPMLSNCLNAFDETVNPNCSFCRIIDRDTRTRDGFEHLFRTCPVTSRLLVQVQWCNLFKPQLDINSESFDNLYWYSKAPAGYKESLLIPLMADFSKYVLWKYKVRKRIPKFPNFIQEIFSVINHMSIVQYTCVVAWYL